jgi:hypothetical protein
MIRNGKAFLAGALLACVGCMSAPLTIKTPPVATNEKVLGEVTGTATGVMVLEFVPVNQNQRFTLAYNEAIAKAPGATRIVNPTITERWYFCVLFNLYKFELKGTAVGPK